VGVLVGGLIFYSRVGVIVFAVIRLVFAHGVVLALERVEAQVDIHFFHENTINLFCFEVLTVVGESVEVKAVLFEFPLGDIDGRTP